MGEYFGIDSPFRGWAMPKSYSVDLRERVIETVEMGASRREAADRFEVSVSSVVKWVQRWHESRNAAPKAARRKRFSAREARSAGIGPDCRTSGPHVDGDGYGVEPAAHSNQQECSFAVFPPPRHHPRKKSLQAAERERADVARARRYWIREQGMLDPARLVFIDETAVSTNMVRLEAGLRVASGWSAAFRLENGRRSPSWPLCVITK